MPLSRLVLLTSAVLVLSSMTPPPLLAQEGQIIVLRPVPSRPATRPGVPAPPFAVKTAPPVDVSPAQSIRDAVGVGVPSALVLTDVEAATISTGAGLRVPGAAGRVAPSVGGLPSAAATAGSTGLTPGVSGARAAVGVAGSVQRATGGLGRTIVNAVAPR